MIGQPNELSLIEMHFSKTLFFKKYIVIIITLVGKIDSRLCGNIILCNIWFENLSNRQWPWKVMNVGAISAGCKVTIPVKE